MKMEMPTVIEMREEPEDKLLVIYAQYGKVEYRRSFDGNLGVEVKDGKTMALVYSEAQKTLMSPHLCARLPPKVVNWVFNFACLASIVSPTQSDDYQDVVHIEAEDDMSIRWTSGRGKYVCRSQPVRCGFVYQFADANGQWESLTWVESDSTWRAGNYQSALPSVIVFWLQADKRRQDIQARLVLERFDHGIGRNVPTLVTRSLPTFLPKSVDVAQVSAALNHNFHNPVLLLMALNHSSNADSSVASNQRLAFVGARVMEALVTEYLVEGTLGTWRWDQENNIVSSYATAYKNGSEPPAVAERPSDLQHELLVEAMESLNVRKDACCNHLAYGLRCVRLQLHKYIQIGEPGALLKDDIATFERVAKRADTDRDPWARLVEHDAPRPLGDVFLAGIAAVVLDSNWRQAKSELRALIKDHVNECVPAAERASVPPLRRTVENTTVQELVRVVSDGRDRHVLGDAAVRALHPSMQGDNISENQQLEAVFALTDVHIFANGLAGDLVGATSPRVAQMRCAYRANRREPTGPSAEEKEEEKEEEEVEEEEKEEDVEKADDGAVYCNCCEKWFNSLTQWKDHKIGKKHGKNLRKQAELAGKNNQNNLRNRIDQLAAKKSATKQIDAFVDERTPLAEVHQEPAPEEVSSGCVASGAPQAPSSMLWPQPPPMAYDPWMTYYAFDVQEPDYLQIIDATEQYQCSFVRVRNYY